MCKKCMLRSQDYKDKNCASGLYVDDDSILEREGR